MSQPGFGLRQVKDDRDKLYPMRLLLDPLREKFFPRGIPLGHRQYRVGPVLNQGSTGTCVAHGWTGRANDAPIMQPLSLSPFDLYRQIIQIDEWTDNDYEANAPDYQLQSGTSVRAGAQVLRRMGYIKNFLWAESLEDIRAPHLAGFGGEVLGIVWTTHMMQVDSEGFVNYSGVVEGGHCVVSKGWNDRVRYRGSYVPALRIKNSWSNSWGQNGYAWIHAHDLEKHMADGGEFCLPVEAKIDPLKE